LAAWGQKALDLGTIIGGKGCPNAFQRVEEIKMRFKGVGWAAVITAASMVLVACGGAAPVPTPVEPRVTVPPLPDVIIKTPTPAGTIPAVFHSKDPTTFHQVQASDIDTLDPAVSVDVNAASILQNVYETLIFYKKDSVTEFIPQLAEEVPSTQNGGISPDGLTYTFKIRKGVKFHNGDELTPSAVAFTFQRGLLSGGTNSLQWLFFEPIFGATLNNDITDFVDINGGFLDNPQKLAGAYAPGLKALCQRVQTQISADDAKGTVTFHLTQPWGPFLMILTGPNASIQDPKWVAANGGWDGSCTTWQNYYDRTVDQQNQSGIGTSANGTGPYMLDHWTPGQEIVLKANPTYWRTTPAWDGGPTGAAALKTIDIQIVKSSSARVIALKTGNADAIGFYASSKPTEMDNVSGQVCPIGAACRAGPIPSSSIRVYTGLPADSRLDALFNFSIDAYGGNPLVGSGVLDGAGVPLNFFTDVHIRQAFSYCFDWNTFIQQGMGGLGRQLYQVMLPDEIGASDKNPHYSYNPQACTDAFKASVWQSSNGHTLWNTGFTMALAPNPRNPASQAFATVLAQGLTAVNAKFHVSVSNLSWEDYQTAARNKKLPIYFAVSHELIADPHNWTDLMTTGSLGSSQQMPQGMKDQFAGLVLKGAQTSDPAARAAVYQQFNQLYYQNAPAILLAQEFQRRYEQRWISGYYYNPIYADLYYYVLSKS
jgi:peptide/nickel transport system substrate-binding protein